MIEQTGQVIKSDEQHVWVQAQPLSGCHNCQAKKGCSIGRATHLQTLCISKFAEPGYGAIKIGDPITLGIDAEVLLKSALVIYGVPLIVLLSALFLAQLFNVSLFTNVLVVLVSLLMGSYVSRRCLKYFDPHKALQIVLSPSVSNP